MRASMLTPYFTHLPHKAVGCSTTYSNHLAFKRVKNANHALRIREREVVFFLRHEPKTHSYLGPPSAVSNYKYFFGAPFLLFLYTMYAPVIIICTATAINKKVVMLGPWLLTTAYRISI